MHATIRLLAAVLVGAAAAMTVAQSSRPEQSEDTVRFVELPIKFPVVGNVAAVQQWRLGRLVSVDQTAGTDIVLTIRMQDNRQVRVTGPGPALADLAWKSDWVNSPGKQFPGAQDYVERLVAFDYDPQFRIIAMASLEPMNRNRTRLWRVLS